MFVDIACLFVLLALFITILDWLQLSPRLPVRSKIQGSLTQSLMLTEPETRQVEASWIRWRGCLRSSDQQRAESAHLPLRRPSKQRPIRTMASVMDRVAVAVTTRSRTDLHAVTTTIKIHSECWPLLFVSLGGVHSIVDVISILPAQLRQSKPLASCCDAASCKPSTSRQAPGPIETRFATLDQCSPPKTPHPHHQIHNHALHTACSRSKL